MAIHNVIPSRKATWHPRVIIGGLSGIIAWALAVWVSAPRGSPVLIGWNVGAVTYLIAAWAVFLRASETDIRARAARQDESPAVITLLALLAIAASLAGIFDSLGSIKGETEARRALVTGLAVLTLFTSWMVVQSLFIAHYAHRHFDDVARDGEKGGFLFPGDAPKSYLDFAYLAICIGATAQVSDPGVQNTGLRNLVTVHAVTSFFYNTAVLAVGINILSGLLGR